MAVKNASGRVACCQTRFCPVWLSVLSLEPAPPICKQSATRLGGGWPGWLLRYPKLAGCSVPPVRGCLIEPVVESPACELGACPLCLRAPATVAAGGPKPIIHGHMDARFIPQRLRPKQSRPLLFDLGCCRSCTTSSPSHNLPDYLTHPPNLRCASFRLLNPSARGCSYSSCNHCELCACVRAGCAFPVVASPLE